MDIRRVLLVDDEPDVLSAIAEALREAGYHVTGSINAEDALRCLRGSLPYDALVTDILMPGDLNGSALAARIREEHPALPVLFVTGVARPADHLRPEQHHDPVLKKPFGGRMLVAALDKLLTAPE
jgi:CheY-like chemotaxis protein